MDTAKSTRTHQPNPERFVSGTESETITGILFQEEREQVLISIHESFRLIYGIDQKASPGSLPENSKMQIFYVDFPKSDRLSVGK